MAIANGHHKVTGQCICFQSVLDLQVFARIDPRIGPTVGLKKMADIYLGFDLDKSSQHSMGWSVAPLIPTLLECACLAITFPSLPMIRHYRFCFGLLGHQTYCGCRPSARILGVASHQS